MKLFALALPSLLAMGVLANPLPEPKPDLVIETIIHADGQPEQLIQNSVSENVIHGT